MAGVVTTSSFAKALWPGVNSWYGKAYNEYLVEHTDLFDTYASRQAWEEDVGTTGFGLASVKPEGTSVEYDDEHQAYLTRYTHAVFGKGFIITREMVEDDLYAVAGEKRAKGLAFSMRQTKEIVGANIYNRGFNSSYTGGDGVELFSAVHPNWSGGTWSNEPAAGADLSEAALEQACIDIAKWTNDRGLRIAISPVKLCVPVDLVFEAERILMNDKRPATADRDINALYQMGKFPGGIAVNHYFTDADAWFIKTNLPSDGMKLFQRRPMQFTIDNDFDTENAKFKSTERYSFGWTDPRAVYGSPGA